MIDSSTPQAPAPPPTPTQPPPPTAPAAGGIYVPTVAAETPATPSNGKAEGIIAIIFAVIALLFFPPIFGALGILLGIRSKNRGQTTLGTVAIVLSAIFLILGIIFGFYVNVYLDGKETAGSLGALFSLLAHP